MEATVGVCGGEREGGGGKAAWVWVTARESWPLGVGEVRRRVSTCCCCYFQRPVFVRVPALFPFSLLSSAISCKLVLGIPFVSVRFAKMPGVCVKLRHDLVCIKMPVRETPSRLVLHTKCPLREPPSRLVLHGVLSLWGAPMLLYFACVFLAIP
jgi:hypothetical protein